MWTLKNQLQFIIRGAMQLGLILPYFIIQYDEANTALIKCYNQLKLLIKWKKPSKPQQLKFMGSLENYISFG